MNKEEIEQILRKKGDVRGVVFQTDAHYVLEKEGEEGLRRLGDKATEFGPPIDYKKTKAMDWHPLGLMVASLLLIKDTLIWAEVLKNTLALTRKLSVRA